MDEKTEQELERLFQKDEVLTRCELLTPEEKKQNLKNLTIIAILTIVILYGAVGHLYVYNTLLLDCTYGLGKLCYAWTESSVADILANPFE